MKIMPIDNINDWEQRLARQDAFWQCAIIDRPAVYMTVTRKNAPVFDADLRNWQSVDYHVEKHLHTVENTEFFGDSLPSAFPNLGPDYFASLYGGNIEFERTTSYIKHSLPNINDFSKLKFSLDGEYARHLDKIYDALFEVGKGRFYVGWPDLHPGADCLAGLRGPQNLCLDLFDDPSAVRVALKTITGDFLKTYDYYWKKIKQHGQAVSGWPGLVSSKRWHVPSCDFSYMISPDQFEEVFLDGIKRECDYMEANLFHLDGKGCLNHLDALLDIKSLNAVQWVYGAGNGSAAGWLDVYRKIQARKKALEIVAIPDDLDVLIENLRPEGVFLYMTEVPDRECAEYIIKKVSKWT